MLGRRKSQLFGANKLAEEQLENIRNKARDKIGNSHTVQEQITDIELALVEIYEVMLNG